MPDIAEHFTTFVMVGIVIVVGTSQFHRGAGAVLGIVFWIATAIFGHFMYAQGAAIGFPGLPLEEPVFLGLCAAFLTLQIIGLRSYRAAQRRRSEYRRELGAFDDSEEDEEASR